MSDIADLVHRNLLEVFNQREGDARRQVMDAVYLPDAVFTDHNGSVSGIDAIDDKIRELHEGTPGFVFTAGEFHEVQELGTLTWTFGPAGAPPVVAGTDVVIVEGGRIAHLYVYLTATS